MIENTRERLILFMHKKTIALLIPTLCNGGAEKIAADMSIFFSDAGFRVVLFLENFNKRNCYKHKGKEIVIHTDSAWDSGCLAKQIFHCLRRASKYRYYKKYYHVDISVSFMVQENLTNILSDVGDKKILTLHSVTSLIKNYKRQLFVRPYVFRKIYQKANAVIAVSRFVKYDLEKNFGIRQGIIDVIYNSVNIDYIKELAKEQMPEKQYENLLLYVGRLDDEKRPWIAVRAMKEIVRRFKNAKLLILGEGDNRSLLEDLIRNMHIEEHVELLGFQQNVAKYMVNAKALMVCSESEAFSCTIAEGLALGLPVAAVDCPGGIREVISMNRRIQNKVCSSNEVVECGVISPMVFVSKEEAYRKSLSNEELMYANGVCMLLEDTELRERLSRNAVNRAQKFSQDRIKEQWLKLMR